SPLEGLRDAVCSAPAAKGDAAARDDRFHRLRRQGLGVEREADRAAREPEGPGRVPEGDQAQGGHARRRDVHLGDQRIRRPDRAEDARRRKAGALRGARAGRLQAGRVRPAARRAAREADRQGRRRGRARSRPPGRALPGRPRLAGEDRARARAAYSAGMSVNELLDGLPRTRFGRASCEVPAFRTCGVTGFYIGVVLTLGAALLTGRSLLVTTTLCAVCGVSFFVYAYVRRCVGP